MARRWLEPMTVSQPLPLAGLTTSGVVSAVGGGHDRDYA